MAALALPVLVLSLAPLASCRAAPAASSVSVPSDGAAAAGRVERFVADRDSLQRFLSAPLSTARIARLRAFLDDEARELARVDARGLGTEDRLDLALLANLIARERARLGRDEARIVETLALLPYAPGIVELLEARQRVEPLDARAAADEIDALARAAKDATKSLADADASPAPRPVGLRAARAAEELSAGLAEWRAFRSGYDPAFDWWVATPHAALLEALAEHARLLRSKVARLEAGDKDSIVGDPIGREALLEELRDERIAHTPEELVAMARAELDWCRARLVEAASEMGLEADWRAALERVKRQHVAPGEQPALVRELAQEAIAYLERNDLVTVPPLAAETWRMRMLSPEAQKVSPFFLGGEVVQVSFPTSSMEHADKLMSLRANNRAFSRAVVHHELIPGHHLQQFMTSRHARHRRAFATPFWTEGWALYWEMLLWDLGFARTPEERIGMLFWRSHRCARVIFSLGFHLGTLTEEQCVSLLVDEVGHERRSAEGEVRRSFGGDYGPLYQLAYLTGGMQFRALHRELVASGRMSPRAFHDAVLQGGNVPVEFVRARLLDAVPAPGAAPAWRFLDAR